MKQVASIAVIGSRDAILFIRRVDNGKWTLPGGHLTEGEKPLDGALRELYEETGIRAPKGQLKLLGSGVVDGKYKVWSYQYKKAHVKPNLDNDPDGEADDFCWFDEDSDSDYASGIPTKVHVPNDKNVTLALLGRTTPAETLELTPAKDLVKMAIKDIAPGEPFEDEYGLQAHDYGHLLPPEWKHKLSLRVHAPSHGEYIKATLVDPNDDDKEVGHVKGELGRFDVPTGTAMTPHSELDEDFHGHGLGKAMYEALYAHAFHKLGIKEVVGGSHSDDAGRVHEALARKHGLQYVGRPKASKFGLNRAAYGYRIDSPVKATKVIKSEQSPYAQKMAALGNELKAKLVPEEPDIHPNLGGITEQEKQDLRQRLIDDKFHDFLAYPREFKAAIKNNPDIAMKLATYGAFHGYSHAFDTLMEKGSKAEITDYVRGNVANSPNQRYQVLQWLERDPARRDIVPDVIDAFASGDRGRRHSAIVYHMASHEPHPSITKEAIEGAIRAHDGVGDDYDKFTIGQHDASTYMDRPDVTPEQAKKVALVAGGRWLMNHPKVPVEDAFKYHLEHIDVRGLHPEYTGPQIKAIAERWDNDVGRMPSGDQMAMAYHPNTPKEVLRLFTHPQPPDYKPFDPEQPWIAKAFEGRSWLGGENGAFSQLEKVREKSKEEALTDPRKAAHTLALGMALAGDNSGNRDGWLMGDGRVKLNDRRTINRQIDHLVSHPLWHSANEITRKYSVPYNQSFGGDLNHMDDAQMRAAGEQWRKAWDKGDGNYDEVHKDAVMLKNYLSLLHNHDWKAFVKENKDQHEREQFERKENWEHPDSGAQRGAASHHNTDRETALELARTPQQANGYYSPRDARLGAVTNPNLTPADLHELSQWHSDVGTAALHALAVQDPDWHHARIAANATHPTPWEPDSDGTKPLPAMKDLKVPDVSTEKVRQLRDKVEALGGKVHHKKVVDNLSPALKPLLDAQGQLSSAKLQEAIDAVPTTTFHVGDSGIKWAGGQQHSGQPSDVFHVNYTGEHVKKLKEAGVWNTFARIQNMITNPTGHPLGPTTIGWVRHTRADAFDPTVKTKYNTDFETGELLYPDQKPRQGGIHIDEVQSDLGQRRLTQQFREHGIHIPEAHVAKIKEILWGKRKTAQDLIAEAFIHHNRQDPKNHGLAMHWPSYELKEQHGSPEDTYKRLPKDLGFAEKAGQYGDLATQTGPDRGPTHTSKITKSDDAFFDQPQHKYRELVNTAVESLSNDLRKPKYQTSPNHLTGHCYVASEALYHMLGGNEAGWVPHHVKHENEPHWYLKHKTTGAILDPTAGQFKTPVPYEQGRGKGFLTKEPSKRAQELISRIKAGMAAKNDPTLKKGQPEPYKPEDLEDGLQYHTDNTDHRPDVEFIGIQHMAPSEFIDDATHLGERTGYKAGWLRNYPEHQWLSELKNAYDRDFDHTLAAHKAGSMPPGIQIDDQMGDGRGRAQFHHALGLPTMPVAVFRSKVKKGILGAVAAGAMAMAPGLQGGIQTGLHMASAPAAHAIEAPPKGPKWTPEGLHASLIPIAHLESSFGQNMNHTPNSKGDYHTAFGPVGFKVNTAHEEWTKSDQLKKLYPGLEDPKDFTDKFKNDWKFYNLLASSHFLRLTHRHGSPEKAAYAWRYGSTAAQGAGDDVIAKEPYVLRYRDLAASTGIKKSERKAKDWKFSDGIVIPHHTNVEARREWDKGFKDKLVEHFAYGNKARLKPLTIPVSEHISGHFVNTTGAVGPGGRNRAPGYLKMLRGNDRLPPLVVRRNGISWHVIDGNARLHAALKHGVKELEAFELVDPVTRKL